MNGAAHGLADELMLGADEAAVDELLRLADTRNDALVRDLAAEVRRLLENEADPQRHDRERARLRAAAGESASGLLNEYERLTRLLPSQHEIPERGCCSYNWRMAIIADLRRILSGPEGRAEGQPTAERPLTVSEQPGAESELHKCHELCERLATELHNLVALMDARELPVPVTARSALGAYRFLRVEGAADQGVSS